MSPELLYVKNVYILGRALCPAAGEEAGGSSDHPIEYCVLNSLAAGSPVEHLTEIQIPVIRAR